LCDVAAVNRAALNERTDPDFTFEYIDISAVGSTGRIANSDPITFSEAPSRARRIISDEDILVSTVRTYLRAIARVPNARGRIASTGFAVVSPKSNIDASYLYWWLSSSPFVEQVVAQSVGVSYPAINASEIAHMTVPLPPLSDQVRITAFLDRECSKIDELIEEQRRLRGLLSELSEARQSELALRGPCDDPDITDSGQWWMGGIPSHWEQVRLKFVARLESGHTPTRSRPELWEDCTIPWISLNDVGRLSESEFVTETVNLISDRGLAESSARILPAGTVVLSRDATVGRCGVMAVPMATSQHFADWVCGPRLEPRYLWLLFRTAMQPYFDSLTAGSTLRTIGVPELRSFVVPLPPVAEQKEIVIAAEAVRRQAEELVAEMRQQEALLIERKQALITAVVTGQLEVA
jgi:type I restriction enzyme S subunit